VSKIIFIRHSSGATHALGGKRLAKLLSELKAGRGQVEMCRLQENGYMETMSGHCISDLTYELALRLASGAAE